MKTADAGGGGSSAAGGTPLQAQVSSNSLAALTLCFASSELTLDAGADAKGGAALAARPDEARLQHRRLLQLKRCPSSQSSAGSARLSTGAE
eukprot:217513-Rhodomonas_salina.1